MHLDDISAKHVKTLTKILQLKPNEDPIAYSNRTLSLISTLPSNLKRPHYISRLVQPAQSSFTTLCRLHKPLHASIVHAIFNLVQLEVGIRLNSLVQNGDLLDSSHKQIIKDLRECHALWLLPEIYERTFLVRPGVQLWNYQADHCEACMLARLTGSFTTLLKLRCVLLSRMTHRSVKRYGEPALARWVLAWIESLARDATAPGLTSEEFDGVLSMNEEDGKALRKIRKAIAHERKHVSRRTIDREIDTISEASSLPSNAMPLTNSPDADFEPLSTNLKLSSSISSERQASKSDDGSAYDAELEIVDAYAALLSTPYLPNMVKQDAFSRIQPARERTSDVQVSEQNSQAFSTQPRAVAEPLPEVLVSTNDDNYPYMHRPDVASVVGSSIYSADTVKNNARVISNGDNALPNTSNIYINPTSSTAQYIPPRLNWKKEPSSGEAISSSNQRAKTYEALLFPPGGPSVTSTSDFWEDVSFASSINLQDVGIGQRLTERQEQLFPSRGRSVRRRSSADSDMTLRPSDSISSILSPKKIQASLRKHASTRRVSTVQSVSGSVRSTSQYSPQRSETPKTSESTRPDIARSDSGETEETHVTRWTELYAACKRQSGGEEFDYYQAEKERQRKGSESGRDDGSHRGKRR